MGSRVAAPANRNHQWVVAATVPLAEPLARQAKRRGTARLPEKTKIDVHEVYCDSCRRPWDAVNGRDCEAAESKDHLIGGPTGERKRTRVVADAAV